MPWSSHGEGQRQQGEEEESLTSILNEGQRGELTLFIASITAAMRKTMESNFDAAVVSHVPHRSHMLMRLGWSRLEIRASEKPTI